ncbi:MAG: LD-carboxypeptidase [Bacteroides sp.]|nr:LD-carboxypeptidase [Bacteroides sp.]
MVVILSPAGKIDKTFISGARKRLESWGLKVLIGKSAGRSAGRFAGTVKQRASDFQEALDSDRIKAIFCSRGGYGAVHLIERLDFTRFAKYPKWLIGYSDITLLHALFQKKGYVSLHAPMARHLTVEKEEDLSLRYLHNLLFGRLPSYQIPSSSLNRSGKAKGILRGGNLAVLSGLRGTPYDFPAEDTILFIEDIGERPYQVERMMYNLKLGGVFDRISGLIIGQFTEYEEDRSLGKELYRVLADLVKPYTFPVCFDFPVGHVTANYPLICGVETELVIRKKEVRLNFLEL